MHELDALCIKIHKKRMNAHGIYLIISSEKFKLLWEATPEQEKKRIEAVILGNNREELLRWVHDHPALELGELLVTRLRERAKRLRIKNYCRLTRMELVREIDRIMKEKDE